MALDRHHWPTLDRLKADLSGRFPLPALPREFDHWFAFAHETVGMDLFLDMPHSERIGYDELSLDGLAVIDSPSALAAMNGYRFVLDQRNSSYENLLWADQAIIGAWQPHWIVIESIQADPFIADISRPGVPVLFARHGNGHWSPEPMFESIADFIASLRAERQVQPAVESLPFYTVTIDNFGPNPKKTLLALKKVPAYCGYAPAALLALTKQTPLVVLENTVSRSLAEKYAQIFRECGAAVQTRSKLLD